MTMRLTNRKGFTLMELLIVIAIIGLIAAIAAPRMGTTISDAKRSQFVGNFATIRTATMLLKAANGGFVRDPDVDGDGILEFDITTNLTTLTTSTPITVPQVYHANRTDQYAPAWGGNPGDEDRGIWNYLDIREAMVYTEEDGGIGSFAIIVNDVDNDPGKNKDFIIFCVDSEGVAYKGADDFVWHSSYGWCQVTTEPVAGDKGAFINTDGTVTISDAWEAIRLK